MTEAEVANALSKKYPSPMYAFLTHVRNGTGYRYDENGTRTADALALSLWPSRGELLEGFEIKVSRSDWMSEWKNPSKAEAIAKYCDLWWIVAGDGNIVKLDELPFRWGLKVLEKGSIKTIKNAELNPEVKPMSKAFLSGFLRNVTEGIQKIYTPTVEVEKIIDERVKIQVDYQVSQKVSMVAEYDKLVDRVKTFEKSSGVGMDSIVNGWGVKPDILGKAVNMVISGKYKRLKEDLEYVMKSAEIVAKTAKEEIDTLPIEEQTI